MAGTLSNYREFTAGLAGTLAILGAFLTIGAMGWEGNPDPCFRQANGCYCESINQTNPVRSAVRLRPGLFAQPVNTWSNVGFILVGLSMLWWTGWERATGRRAPWNNRFTDGSGYVTMFALIVIFMGPGSMFFHASLREWGGWIDSLSMNLFMGFIAAYNVVRFFRMGIGWFTLFFLLLVGTASILTAADSSNGQIYFFVLCGLAFISQVLIYWRPSVVSAPWGWWWFIAGASVFLTALVIWRLSWTKAPLCDPDAIAQGHGAWHLLSAAMTFCLWQYFRAEDASVVIAGWMWKMANVFFGIIMGLVVGGGFGYLFGDQILDADSTVTLILAAVFGGFGAVFSAIAFAHKIYGHNPLAIIGYILDLTWSSVNTLAGLIVWIPASLLAGGKLQKSTPDSRRSGCFVYNVNPRGAHLDTTIGTVVAGGWSAHEEVHVWQARIFGPAYMVTYGLSWVLNVIFRLVIARTKDIAMTAYRRIIWEDWAYWGGASSGSGIRWGAWTGGFFLTLLYLSLLALIPIGIAMGEIAIWAGGIAGICLYSLIRSLAGPK
ncbi:MAG: ceramidase domain-containing protein [Bryobacteraceae bacterium]|nr:ceramidase domain-containing protein [Bryobacteraceae bacterium]